MKYLIFIFLLLLLGCSDGKSSLNDEDSSGSDIDNELSDNEANDDVISDSDEISDSEDPDIDIFTDIEETCEYFGATCGDLNTSTGSINCGECPQDAECGRQNLKNVCIKEVCSYGYCWVNPYPQGDSVTGAAFLKNGDMFFVSTDAIFSKKGDIYDAHPYQLRSGGSFSSIIAFDEDNVWASATDGCLLKNEEGFFSCLIDNDNYYSPTKSAVYQLAGTKADDIYAAAKEGLIHYDGTEWKLVYKSSSRLRTLAIHENTVFAAGENIITSYIDGDPTKKTFDGDIFSIDVSAEGVVAVLSVSETASKVTLLDSQLNTTDSYDLDGIFNALAFLDEKVVAVGNDGKIAVNKEIYDSGIKRNFLSVKKRLDRISIMGEGGIFASWNGSKLSSNQGFFKDKATSAYASSTSSVWVATGNMIVHFMPNSLEYYPMDSKVTEIYGNGENLIYAETENDILRFTGSGWKKITSEPADAKQLKEDRDKKMTLTENSVSWKFDEEKSFKYECSEEKCSVFLPGASHAVSIWPDGGLEELPVSAVFSNKDRFTAAGGKNFVKIDHNELHTTEYDFSILAYDSNGTVDIFGSTDGKIIVIDSEGNRTEKELPAKDDVTFVSVNSNDDILAVSNGKAYMLKENITKIESEKFFNCGWLFDDGSAVLGGDNVIANFDGTNLIENAPGDLTERGLPAGETEILMTNIFAIDNESIWMLGSSPDDQTAYIFSYDGDKWMNDARSSLYDELHFTDVWACDYNNAMIPMDALGYIYHYKNMSPIGIIESVDSPLGSPIHAITADPLGDLYIFGDNGIIMRSTSPCLKD